MPVATDPTRANICALFQLPVRVKYGKPDVLHKDVKAWLHYSNGTHEELSELQFEAWWTGLVLNASFEQVTGEFPTHLELRWKKRPVWVVALPKRAGHRFTFKQTFSVGKVETGWEPA